MNKIEQTLRAMNVLSPGKGLIDFMLVNRLAEKGETVADVFFRTTRFLAQAGASFYGPSRVDAVQKRFLKHVNNFEIILGSPILTNAGRREKSISACSIPPVKLSTMSRNQIAQIVGDYHTRGMGTGFSLDDVEDPVSMVIYLNQVAISEVQKGLIERSCGNMGVLSIDHPKVLDFIRIKTDHPEIKEWKFNLSVNLTDDFIQSLNSKKPFELKDKTLADPEELMDQIALHAHGTGDPGLVFMDRINRLNRIPQAGTYKTLVPCGEVSLFEGEVCQFAYLNLMSFVDGQTLDRDRLREAIHSAVLLLDNAVEANIQRMPNKQSASIISSVRRIGLGVCGFAEMLQAFGMPYDSPVGRNLAKNVMSFIQYESKMASVNLSRERGPFPLFNHDQTRKNLFIDPFRDHPTEFVEDDQWRSLQNQFSAHKIRNLATTIIPPSGRSSLMAGVTPSIEPPFRLVDDDFLRQALQRQTDSNLEPVYRQIAKSGSLQNSSLPDSVKNIFKTALEISPQGHLLMTAAFQQFTDEGISKTVNMPQNATPNEVKDIFRSSYHLGLKGVTIYRNNCRTLQPKKLTEESKMIITDPIYGTIPVTEKISKILHSPFFKRLNQVHQNGVSFLVDPRQSTSRYQHSLGALALAQLLGADESTQVAALLHDVSHTAFSHLADLVFQHKSQNYHDLIRKQFLESEEGKKFIAECGISSKELACELNRVVKGDNLNVDRIDYCIRDLSSINQIYHPEYSSILNQLVIEDGVIKCKNLATAKLFFEKFLQVNQEVYFDPKGEAASVAVTTILKKMLDSGELSENDFLTTDDQLIEKIKNSRWKETFEAIGPGLSFTQSDVPTGLPPVLRKLRYVNPQIVGLDGHLTDHCPESKARLEQYLNNTPTTIYYSIPIIQ